MKLIQQRAPDMFFSERSTDIDQLTVLDTGGAGRLATAAGQTAIQMRQGFVSDRVSFEDLLDQVNPATWTIQFITQQLIGWAGRGTKSAMHTVAQDFIGALTEARVFVFIDEVCLHMQKKSF